MRRSQWQHRLVLLVQLAAAFLLLPTSIEAGSSSRRRRLGRATQLRKRSTAETTAQQQSRKLQLSEEDPPIETVLNNTINFYEDNGQDDSDPLEVAEALSFDIVYQLLAQPLYYFVPELLDVPGEAEIGNEPGLEVPLSDAGLAEGWLGDLWSAVFAAIAVVVGLPAGEVPIEELPFANQYEAEQEDIATSLETIEGAEDFEGENSEGEE